MLRPANQQVATLAEDLALSERLSRMQGQEITPSAVIRVLQQAKVRHVLVGAHAISAWAGDPRATIDVDIVAARPNQARDALVAAFADLVVEDHPAVIRLKRGGREAIDVIKPASSPIFKAALKHTIRSKIDDLQMDVPQLEMAIALKFAAMASPTRSVKDKYQDAHDFIAMIQRHPAVAREKLSSLGDLVRAGGGDAVIKLVDDALAGRKLVF